MSVGATLASGKGGSSTNPACLTIGLLLTKSLDIFVSKSCWVDNRSDPMIATADNRHPVDSGTCKTSWGRLESLSKGTSCRPGRNRTLA